jgi:hypothetical protein
MEIQMLGISHTPLTLIVLGALAACAQFGVTVTRVDYAHQYAPLEVSAAGGGDRQLQVLVMGNPFDVPQADLERATIKSMQWRTFGVPVNFAITPTNTDPNRDFRVVVAFNPEGIGDPGKLCEAEGNLKSNTNDAGITTLMGAFCTSDSYLSHAIARAPDIEGINSATFDSLVAQLTLSLFPDENPHNQVEGDTGAVLVN